MKSFFKIFFVLYLIISLSTLHAATQSCIKVDELSPPTGQWYWSVSLKFSNHCQHDVDMRNATFNLETPFKPSEVRINFDNSNISWSEIKTISQTQGTAVPDHPNLSIFENVFSLNYGNSEWLKTKLSPGASLTLTVAASLTSSMNFTVPLAELMTNSFSVNIEGQDEPDPEVFGTLTLNLNQAPEQKSDFPKSATLMITGDKNYSKSLNINFGSSYKLDNLTLGTYTITTTEFNFGDRTYHAPIASPISLTKKQLSQQVNIEYSKKDNTNFAKALFRLNDLELPLPIPVINLFDDTNGSKTTLNLAWGNSITVDNLISGHHYRVRSSEIDGYSRTVLPSSFTAGMNQNLMIDIQYLQSPPPNEQGKIELKTEGLTEYDSVIIEFQNNSTEQKFQFNLTAGINTLKLNEGVYTVSTLPVHGYRASLGEGVNPFSVTKNETISLTITYKKLPPSNNKKRIVAYFTAWGIYGRNYQVTDIPVMHITDINYAFVNIVNGECALGDPWADVDKRFPAVTTAVGKFPMDSWNGVQKPYYGNFNRLNRLQALAQVQQHHINLFLSIGGWTWSKYFSDVAATPNSRSKFVDSCIAMMKKYRFNGIDIDWEYPVSGGLASNHYRAEDKENYTKLLALFRQRLGTSALLTIAAPAGPTKLPNIEWNKISQYVDWVNLMAYDFHGGWDKQTGHNAALYPNPNEPGTDPNIQALNVDSAVDHIQRLNFPISKLVIGVGFYGRGWQSVSPTNNGLFQSGVGSSLGTWEPGVFDYSDIIKNYKPTSLINFDQHAKVPYLYIPTKQLFITYEDPASMNHKVQYIINRNLGGVMFWELSGDIKDVNDPRSLLKTLSTQLLEK